MHKTLSFSRARPHRRVRARVQASTHSFGGTAQERTLDGLLYLEALKVKTPGQQTVLSVANTYGKVQELKTSNRSESAGGANSVKKSQYTYDDETRLTQAKTDTGGLFGTDTENFTLDAVGNRIAHSKVNGAWTYDANNRLTKRGSGPCGSTGTTCYDWDEAGNLAQKTEAGKTTQYSYDTQNRLIEVQDTTGGQTNPAATLIARYGYDPLDRRIWKEQYRDANGQGQSNPLAPAQRTYYLYADEGLIAESTQAITLNADGSVSASTAPQITTQYGPRPDSEFTTGTLFVKTKNSNGQDRFAYLHHDHLQTPLQATDKAGNVVWAASYNAFGKGSITTPAATPDKPTITVNLRLPGQYLDEETGLHYNWHRYYDGEIGRYLTEDPIGLRGGINRYAYVNGVPTIYTDPLGLWAVGDPLPDWVVDSAAGFGDGVSFGGTRAYREWREIDGGVNKCSGSYKGGDFAGSMLGPLGRFGYIGKVGTLATKVPQTAAQAAAFSAERNAIKRYFRGPLASWIPDYKTAAWAEARFAQQGCAAFANSAGKSNYGFNALAGFGSINASMKAGSDDGCTCK